MGCCVAAIVVSVREPKFLAFVRHSALQHQIVGILRKRALNPIAIF
jgi:hypothetical protein